MGGKKSTILGDSRAFPSADPEVHIMCRVALRPWRAPRVASGEPTNGRVEFDAGDIARHLWRAVCAAERDSAGVGIEGTCQELAIERGWEQRR